MARNMKMVRTMAAVVALLCVATGAPARGRGEASGQPASAPEEPQAHVESRPSEDGPVEIMIIARGNNASGARRYAWYAIEDRTELDAAIGTTVLRLTDAARTAAYERLDTGGTLVLVALGERPTGGYAIAPISAVTTPQGTRITIREQRPARGAIVTQAFTYPWLLLAATPGPLVAVELAE